MKPDARDPQDVGSERSEITPTRLFAAFSEERRQHVLTYLAQKPAALHLDDLTEYVALVENRSSDARHQQIIVDLHHRHLPQLRDAGLVRYDDETTLVELAVSPDVVVPYLRLAGHVR